MPHDAEGRGLGADVGAASMSLADPAMQEAGEPSPLTDAALIERSRSEPRSFAEVFDRHAHAIQHYLACRVGAQAAEDLAGETFLIAFSRRAHYDCGRLDARPWLYGIATNLVREHRRAERRMYRAVAGSQVDAWTDSLAGAVVERISARTELRLVAKALARLAPRDRDVLLLYAWGGLRYEDIALALGVPVGTVRSRLNRGRRRLRRMLAAPPLRSSSTNTQDS
jgi:RNA polymerase sigma-70 factor, ECF subfamily